MQSGQGFVALQNGVRNYFLYCTVGQVWELSTFSAVLPSMRTCYKHATYMDIHLKDEDRKKWQHLLNPSSASGA